ncbi:hypothetical protein F4780DRAFT_774392 [Xylariomycetidae sp. FL0641]|nr:hypothetical protein F4780DRAFT_774392 [Xylariomycetidae sp. FL0641]
MKTYALQGTNNVPQDTNTVAQGLRTPRRRGATGTRCGTPATRRPASAPSDHTVAVFGPANSDGAPPPPRSYLLCGEGPPVVPLLMAYWAGFRLRFAADNDTGMEAMDRAQALCCELVAPMIRALVRLTRLDSRGLEAGGADGGMDAGECRG